MNLNENTNATLQKTAVPSASRPSKEASIEVKDFRDQMDVNEILRSNIIGRSKR